jgi:hypothetical protein
MGTEKHTPQTIHQQHPQQFQGMLCIRKLGKSFSGFIAKKRLITDEVNPLIDAVNPLFYIRR